MCFTSGQVFRWDETPDGWVGVDGPWWYQLRRRGDELHVVSNGSEATLSRFFQLHVDVAALEHSIVAAGPELAPLLEFARGLRVLRYTNPAECLFTFLCTANNHVARIGSMVRRLSAFGDVIPESGGVCEFPSIERLAGIPEIELRQSGFGYRAASIPKVAQVLLGRGAEAYITAMSDADYKTIRNELVSIPSIGPKLADCIALFGFGCRESIPVDTHMWKVATRLYFPHYAGTPLSPHKYEEFATFFRNRFGEHSGWAHQALFFESLLNWRTRKSASNKM